ncbi:MAG: metallophosphoesterase family protein [Nitrososphaerales archaeon]
MQPIKLLHTADLHVGMENYGRMDPETGTHGRVMDFLRRLTDMGDYAIDEGVDIFVFAGDAYKMRDPNPTFQREFARRIKRVADAGIPVVLLVGNHDLPPVQRRATSISIFDTLQVPNVYVGADYAITTITCRRGQQLQVATAPYPLRQDHIAREEGEGKSVEELDRLLSERLTARIMDLAHRVRQDPETPAILAGHFSVDEAAHGSERNIMVGRDVAVDRSAALADPIWRYVALGHIHKHQSLNHDEQPPIIFSGSPERIDFGEEREPKGWVVATIGEGQTIWQFQEQYRRQPRPFRTIKADVRDAEDPTAEVVKQIESAGDLSETVVRLQIVLDETQELALVDRDIKLALKDVYDVASIQRDVQRQARDRLGGVSVEALTPVQMLDRYLDTRRVDEAHKKLLLQYAEDLIREADSQSD